VNIFQEQCTRRWILWNFKGPLALVATLFGNTQCLQYLLCTKLILLGCYYICLRIRDYFVNLIICCKEAERIAPLTYRYFYLTFDPFVPQSNSCICRHARSFLVSVSTQDLCIYAWVWMYYCLFS